MTQSIVIHGPQGCGKSMNAKRLMRHFGLARVIEFDDHPEQAPFPQHGVLVLTNDKRAAEAMRGLQVLSFKEAMRVAGFLRTPSNA